MKNTSPHILSTSANLLGFCFVVLTSLKIRTLPEGSLIDDLTAVATLFFAVSSLLSFLSMRSPSRFGSRAEQVADWVFMGGLGLVFLTVALLALHYIH